jgi:hypothetical protein
MYKGKISWTDVINKVIVHANLNFIKSEDFIRLYSIKRYIINDRLLRFLKNHEFEEEICLARGKVLVDKKFREESGGQLPLSNCSWLLLPTGMSLKKQTHIDLGVNFNIDEKDACAVLNAQINVPHDMPSADLPHRRLFDVLFGYNDGLPKPKGKIVEEIRQFGHSFITFDQLGIKGAKVFIPPPK